MLHLNTKELVQNVNFSEKKLKSIFWRHQILNFSCIEMNWKTILKCVKPEVESAFGFFKVGISPSQSFNFVDVTGSRPALAFI